MRFHTKHLLPILVLALPLAGCTSPQKKAELNQQVQAEPTKPDLQKEVKQSLLQNPKLTEAQRVQLRDLQASTHEKYMNLHTELRQTESLLVKKLADPQASIKEVDYLKSKVRTLSHKQTDLALNSINKASEIVGKRTPMDEDFYQHFLEPENNEPIERIPPR